MQIARAFKPILTPSRYKAFYGGRGGAKSHSFAGVLALKVAQKKLKWLCCREVQKSIKESVYALIKKKIEEEGLNDYYRIFDTEIRHRDDSPAFVFSGLRTNPDAVKSMEGLDGAWVEEAHTVSSRSIELLTPTVRKDNSEVWFSWNPELAIDPVDKMFRGNTPPPDSIVKMVSWRDNPWFISSPLYQDMLHDKGTNRGKWEHIWEGGYRVAWEDVFFDGDRLIEMLDEIESPVSVGSLVQTGNKVRFYPNVDPWLEVFEAPQPNEDYVLGGDVSEGLSTGDQHAVHVLKRGLQADQVARFAPRCNEAELGRRMVLVAKWYAQHGSLPPIAPEGNNMGRATVLAIQETEYENLYNFREAVVGHLAKKPGWYTTTTSRPLMLADLAEAIEEGSIRVKSRETLAQLRTFLKQPNGKPEGAEGCHDDEVIGLAIAYQMIVRTRPQRTFSRSRADTDYAEAWSPFDF